MDEIMVRLVETIYYPPYGGDNPGFIILAGTRGVLRRVRTDPDVILAERDDGREGSLRWGYDVEVGYAEVDFESYIRWCESSGLGDEERRVSPESGGWTVLNVPLEKLSTCGG